MKNVKKMMLVFIFVVLAVVLVGCRQADRVSRNVSQQADNFNVTRRLAVINARTDKPVFEIIGRFSMQNTTTNELAVIVETDQGVYKKHYVYLNSWTIYVVEDVSGAYVDPYHYEVNFLPEMIIPVTMIQED